jgi:hypothetical protein
VPISAFELEVAVQPEKGEARSRNSIQPQSDPRARREYGQALRRLQAEREEARTAGELEEMARLAGEIEALEAALKGVGAADTGERARINVRKAVVVVLGQLRKRGPEEKALAEHLRRHLSTGYEWLYLPVRIVARLGLQMELTAKQLSNLMPALARRSRLGVLFTWLP